MDNRLLHDNVYKLAGDPKKTYLPPAAHDAVPYLNFSDLDNALVQMKTLAEDYQRLYGNGLQLPPAQQNQLNELLFKAERSLTAAGGLPRRPWYKHEIYAPGFYTGYGVKTLPAIREAIEQRNWKEAQEGIRSVTQAVTDYNSQVQQAVKLLTRPTF